MPISSAKLGARALMFLSAGLVACNGDRIVAPPSEATCDGVTQQVIALEPFEARVLTGAAVHCSVLAGAGARYLVMPQLTGATLPYGGYGFRLGDPDAAPTVSLVDAGALRDATSRDTSDGRTADHARARLDALLRRRERVEPVARPMSARSQDLAMDAIDPLREFSVLNTLAETPTWAPVSARLRFTGARVLVYVDTAADAVLSDAQIASMGALYDDALIPLSLEAFGAGSDVDGNGRVIFVLSPVVNAMVTAAECAATGFVRGFFYSHDLASTAATSNRGEVFYAYVPDPTGRWSCSHTSDEVVANLPPTFIHELQHMISYGAHVLARGGPSEESWLNEGLSHVAEELGSLYWESRFPPPSGRTNPSQIFPDSSAPYINPDLLYSYRFLLSSASYSLTGCAPGSFCSQSERGAVWLFLRWIADQKGALTFRQLVQTPLTGRANVESVTDESTAALLGDFAITVSADSLEGIARDRVAARYRFTSRNFRAIYRKLFEAFGLAGGVGRPFPIAPVALTEGTTRTGTTRPGTFTTFQLTSGSGTPTLRLRFAVPDGSPFPASTGAQVSIFRLP